MLRTRTHAGPAPLSGLLAALLAALLAVDALAASPPAASGLPAPGPLTS